jgi:hypothetical protein
LDLPSLLGGLTDWEEEIDLPSIVGVPAEAEAGKFVGLDCSLDSLYLIRYIYAWLRFAKPGVSRSGSPSYAMRRRVLGLPLESGVWHLAIQGTFGQSVRE